RAVLLPGRHRASAATDGAAHQLAVAGLRFTGHRLFTFHEVLMAFDISSEIVFPMRLVSTKSLEVEITVRWPTDAEWLKRARARRVIRRKPRAGVNEPVLPMPGPHDVELYESIKLNGAPAMTPAEADKVLNAMSRSEVTDVRLEGA